MPIRVLRRAIRNLPVRAKPPAAPHANPREFPDCIGTRNARFSKAIRNFENNSAFNPAVNGHNSIFPNRCCAGSNTPNSLRQIIPNPTPAPV